VVGSYRFGGMGWLTTGDAAQRWRQLPEPEMPSRTPMSRAFVVPPSSQNRHYARRHPVYTKRAQEQVGVLVVATPAYQTAYQSVRPGPITQVLRRTLATLSAAVKRGRILADTEEVTGSNPVSPTSNTPCQPPVCDLARGCGAWTG
jgi:hypothetical protein